MKFLLLALGVLLLSIVLVSALKVDIPVVASSNTSLYNVNNSDFLDGLDSTYFVPYSGATGDVDLGSWTMKAYNFVMGGTYHWDVGGYFWEDTGNPFTFVSSIILSGLPYDEPAPRLGFFGDDTTYSEIWQQSGNLTINSTSTKFTGAVCNSTVCKDLSKWGGTGGGMDYTNIALTNKSNTFTQPQNFTNINTTIQYINTIGNSPCPLTSGFKCRNNTGTYEVG